MFSRLSSLLVGAAALRTTFAFVPAPLVGFSHELFSATSSKSESSSSAVFTSVKTNGSTASQKSKSPLYEYLKFGGTQPDFDVIAKSREYIETYLDRQSGTYEHLYDKDYVLRGPVIGPINRKDLGLSQNGLGIQAAFDTKIESFGYTIDPENPYRCFYFQRWRAVMNNDMDMYGDILPATGEEVEMPVSVFSVVWTPEGKIIYEQVGAVVDRFEGNTQGKAAVFGLLHHAGIKLSANPGDGVFGFVQRLGHVLGGRGRSWSRKAELPKWWVSKSRGADDTDQW